MRAVTIKDHYELTPVDGEIGLEIEMEGGVSYPDGSKPVSDYWVGKADPSMQGPGVEYVLKQPIPRTEVRPALLALKGFWKTTKAKLTPTDRDGVHIHFNCQNLMQEQVMTFILMLVLLEDVLVRWCGESREGNIFCLRSRDAEEFLSRLRDILIKKTFSGLDYEVLKYAAINIAPLCSYGSVEIRCMETPKDIMRVETWVRILCCVYDAALKLQSVRDVADQLAFSRGEELIWQIFGDLAPELLEPAGGELDLMLMEGRRRVKEVVYSSYIYKERKKNKTLIAPPPPARKKISKSEALAAYGGGLVAGSEVSLSSVGNYFSELNDTEVVEVSPDYAVAPGHPSLGDVTPNMDWSGYVQIATPPGTTVKLLQSQWHFVAISNTGKYWVYSQKPDSLNIVEQFGQHAFA